VEWGFEVSMVEPILVNGVRVSSSQIRGLIEEGRVDEARALLGRFHFVSGTVVEGNRRGRVLGFPTANIASRTEVIPSDGIYATLFHIGQERWLSVSSIGVNPTFGAGPRTLESFILDFDRDIYGESIRVAFLKKIREEEKFADVASLIARMQEDVRRARAVFDSLGIAGRVS
jgi:riboflavin kinase/FMN adenylyltransferase